MDPPHKELGGGANFFHIWCVLCFFSVTSPKPQRQMLLYFAPVAKLPALRNEGTIVVPAPPPPAVAANCPTPLQTPNPRRRNLGPNPKTQMGDIQIQQAPRTGQHAREIPRGRQDLPFPIDKRKQPTKQSGSQRGGAEQKGEDTKTSTRCSLRLLQCSTAQTDTGEPLCLAFACSL